ncbi:DNA topoisomerase I domain protein [Helicobacter pylori Hp P-1]|nr:DNA topoisomerase I domain protein [Helicobacter pylori Hp P-1]
MDSQTQWIAISKVDDSFTKKLEEMLDMIIEDGKSAYLDLMQNIQKRLGTEISNLYRNNSNNNASVTKKEMIPPTEKQLNFVETIEKTLQIKASDMTRKDKFACMRFIEEHSKKMPKIEDGKSAYLDLMQNIQKRLGTEISNLYRNNSNNNASVTKKEMIPPTEKQLNFVETIEKTLQIKASDMTRKDKFACMRFIEEHSKKMPKKDK